MKKGLVLFDYDGTLVDEREAIYVPTALTKKAISMLQDQGYLCMLATGRALSYIPQGAKDLYLDGYITCNGAYVCVHGKEILNEVFKQEELASLLVYLDEHKINYILESKDYCFVKDLQDPEYLHFLDNYKIPQNNYVSYQGLDQVEGLVSKITLVFQTMDQLHEVEHLLRGFYQVSVHRNCNTFDIGQKNMNKGVGVKAVIDHYQLPYDETYAFGDGDNDVELLASVKYGIAMGIYHPDLEPVLYMVTNRVKDEGIYHALQTLKVIK